MPRRFTRASEQRFTLTPGDFTISGDFTNIIWVRWLTFSGTDPQYFMSGGDFAQPNSWNTFIGAPGFENNWRVFIVADDNSGIQSAHASPSSSDREGLWTPTVIRRTGTSLDVFVVSRTNIMTETFNSPYSLANLVIGARTDFDAARFFDGEIGHLAHYTTALSNDAVDDLMDGENPLTVRDRYGATLQRYFPMDEPSGNIVDRVSRTVVGTAVNSPGAGLGTDPVNRYDKRSIILVT